MKSFKQFLEEGLGNPTTALALNLSRVALSTPRKTGSNPDPKEKEKPEKEIKDTGPLAYLRKKLYGI